MRNDRKEILENDIKQLQEKYSSVYILKKMEGMSIKKAARALAISKINAKVRLYRARTMLKNIISSVPDASNLFIFGNERCDCVSNAVMDYIRKKEK